MSQEKVEASPLEGVIAAFAVVEERVDPTAAIDKAHDTERNVPGGLRSSVYSLKKAKYVAHMTEKSAEVTSALRNSTGIFRS